MAGTIDAPSFRKALGAFTTGVTIVTTIDETGADIGITANSFNSVSLDPPLVLWSIGKSSTNLKAFLTTRHFAVHILAGDQDALASLFSKRGVDRFAGLSVARGPDGIPLLDGCTARFQCRSAFQYEGGDHVILVGEVLEFDHYDREPLVFKGGRFAFAVPKTEPVAGGEPKADVPAAPSAFAPDFLIYQLGRAYYQLLMPIQPELERRGLSMAEYFALSMLGIRDGRSPSELDRLVSHTGVRVTSETIRRLADLGLVTTASEAVDGRVALTPAGQRTVMELLAVAKAASDDAEEGLDRSESRLLRQLLGRIIASSDAGLPLPWQV
jgi:3-hydroxy-9,10-secoandrosta-1,3,5(10)-triene-9,17-dione monooxygenase reductase component